MTLPDWISLPGVLPQVEDDWLDGVLLLRVCGDTRHLLTRAEVYTLFGERGKKTLILCV